MKLDKNILVLDDNKTITTSLSEELEKNGFKTECAHSSHEAIEMARMKNYELVFLDVFLKDTSGIEAYKLIKGEKPQTKIVFMSGYVDDVCQEEKTMTVYGNDIPLLHKPFQKGSVLNIVKQILLDKNLEVKK